MNLREIKDELERLEEVSAIINNFEKNSVLHKKEFIMQIKDDTPFKIKLVNSALKEKQEINERLNELSYNLGLLRSTVLTNDTETTRELINKFLDNGYSGVSVIMDELNDFKLKIKKADENYKKILDKMPKGLDYKINNESEYEKHIKKLNSLHKKQKELFVSMSQLFVKLTRKAIKDKRLDNLKLRTAK